MLGHHRDRQHDHHHHHHHRRRWAGEPPPDWPWGRFGRRWGGFGVGPGPNVGERFFGRGDLKYVILDLLKDQPRHGYDIIRALEGRSGGFYRPSPGSVYPTLQMLEDLGYVEATQQEGKKVYAITDAGRQFLSEQGDFLDDLRSRVASAWGEFGRGAGGPELGELMHELGELARALFRLGSRGVLRDRERLRQLRAVLQRARADIEALEHQTPTTVV
jgi:DNA-binding PadR family transcriptional regulator